MFGMLLRTKNYTVHIAASLPEAKEKLSDPFDLILLDLMSSEQDVYELSRYIKTQETTQRIPLIVLSSLSDQSRRLELLALPVDDLVAKPIQTEELFIRIDAALRRTSPHLTALAQQEHATMHQEISSIIQGKHIIPYFQPIYRLDPMEIYGFEMLARPQTNTSLKNPDIFFKEAMKVGLYLQVEMLAWEKALAIFQVMQNVNQYKMFLNCNPYLIEHNNFNDVNQLFKSFDMQPQRIYLELTERSSIGEFAAFNECLNQYRVTGFNIAVDDVGGGYSSLETIIQTKPHVVKIDRQIITGFSKDMIKTSVVKLLVSFCRENNIMCVAEGVETQEDLDAIRKLGVDAAQGYYLCRPQEHLAQCFK